MKNTTDLTLKIVVGLGCVDDYPSYVEAGADEVFCGYIPHDWAERYDMRKPLNRREVNYYNVQLGAESELMILRDMKKFFKIPAIITINSLSFERIQYEPVRQVVEKCLNYGFDRFIVADIELIKYLRDEFGNRIRIHVSGEYGEMNRGQAALLDAIGTERIIFPRQTSLLEMQSVIAHSNRTASVGRDSHNSGISEWEAFVLNEKCHFTGAYCNSLHCDEMCHICKLPYRLTRLSGTTDATTGKNAFEEKRMKPSEHETCGGIIGETGCGLCALWRLREAGVGYLKLVSRGNGSEDTLRDIRALVRAREILQESGSESEYIQRMKADFFANGCSGNCYYYDCVTP